MGRIFSKPLEDAPEFPTSIWDIINPVTNEAWNGWIELTMTSDKAADIEPTVEAGIVNSLQEECGRTAKEHGNFGEELADAIVRILDTGTFTKDSLGDQLLHKMAINRDRPYMHGDKVM
jgi:hypothetical protein